MKGSCCYFFFLIGILILLLSPCDGVRFLKRRRYEPSLGGDKDAEEARKNSHPYEKDSCKPELTHPTHGSVFCSNGNKYESVCQYTCDEGYQLSDPESSVLICKGKNWIGEEPVCVAVPEN